MELKLPPPLLFLLCAVAIYFSPTLFEPILIAKGIALLAVLFGLVLDLSSLWGFLQKRTTVNPLAPKNTTALVTNGVYRFTRNPMYLSLALYLLAGSLWLGKLLGFFAIWLFIWAITRFQIRPEERILTQKFGQAYLAYQAKVRRWL